MAEAVSINWLAEFRSLDRATREKGLGYFQERRVKQLDFNFPLLRGIVRGSGSNHYSVTLHLLPEGYASSCSCPMGTPCKHLAAVLLAADQRGIEFRPPDSPDAPAAAPVFPEATPLRGETLHAAMGTRPHPLFRPPHLVRGTESPEGGERWRLAFQIAQPSSYYESDALGAWIARPVLRYLKKKTLEPGRIAKFDAEKLSVPPSPLQGEIVRICETVGPSAGFLRLMEHLLAGTEALDVVMADSPQTLAITETAGLVVSFAIAGLSLGQAREAQEVRWKRSLASAEGEVVSLAHPHRPAPDTAALAFGNDLLLIQNHGSMFRLRGAADLHAIVQTILQEQDRWQLSDIRELETVIRAGGLDAPDRVSFLRVHGQYGTIEVLTPAPQAIVALRPSPRQSFPRSNSREAEALTQLDIAFNYGRRRVDYEYTRNADYLFTPEAERAGDTLYRRRLDWEKDFRGWLVAQVQADRAASQNPYLYNLDGAIHLRLTIPAFIDRYALGFLERGIAIELEGQSLKVSRGNFRVALHQGSDWFEFIPTLGTEDGEALRIPNALQLSPEGMLKIGNRFIRLQPEDLERLKRYLEQKNQAADKGPRGGLSVHRRHFAELEAAAGLLDGAAAHDEVLAKSLALAASLRQSAGIPPAGTGRGFAGELRPYQQAGVDWLSFLDSHGLNGLLADDMGLGKTIQTIAFLCLLQSRSQLGLVVVVAPVSTMGNWEREIRRFAPGFTVHVHHGSGRSMDKVAAHGINIVSYATLRSDADFFAKLDIHYLVLDEAQTVKNAESLTFKAVKQLKAHRRLSLSGTPVENNTLELWSQMDFLEPGLLGTRKEFQSRFANPIEEKGDRAAAERLRRLVFPFILRRRKADVAKDLPPKEEITVFVDMAEDQSLFYESVRRHYAEKVEAAIQEHGLANSAMAVLEGLLRLRQAALFPALVDSTKTGVSSCKFEALKELLTESCAEGQKTLLFSQFVQSLDFIKAWLDESGMAYAYLDGQTKERSQVIERFQTDPALGLFLLSLKAGGVGINLTAAEYVVLFDPWWNPAVESQAVDRSHRIGQDKKVIVYRMIVKGTVEEKILALQERKKDLVNQLVTEDAGFYKSLSAADVLGLFENADA